MRIALVIGTVTLSQGHPSLTGAAWRVCAPLDRETLQSLRAGDEEPFVTLDELGAGVGSLIAVSEGAEASAPFHPEVKPIDAYNAAILDTIQIGERPV
ncbi:MAG TPA: EutN/CcmL family microcompartment protein [Planctomycetaceae bacterium]|jgi:ethanolamine utilization protein EutN|nr:EutN/CcmL family microcompartment protein [Planctomycetaceae bacterium]